MTLPDLPPLGGASLVECFVHWKQDMAVLLLRLPNAPDLLVHLHGLVQLRLDRGAPGGEQVQSLNGPIKTAAGSCGLRLEMVGGGLLEVEFTSLKVQQAFPGQKHVNDADLYAKFSEILRATVHSLAIHELQSVRLLPRIGVLKTVPHEVHEYPTDLADPPPEAYEQMQVWTIGSHGGRWRVEMPLWTLKGPSGLAISMEVHRVDDDLVGYLEAVVAR